MTLGKTRKAEGSQNSSETSSQSLALVAPFKAPFMPAMTRCVDWGTNPWGGRLAMGRGTQL